jgi:hypothetical protein
MNEMFTWKNAAGTGNVSTTFGPEYSSQLARAHPESSGKFGKV